MTLQDIQADVDDWIKQYVEGYWTPHQIFARLGEEVGEIGREINHLYGPKKKKLSEHEGDLGEEIADVIFTLCCLANSQEIDLDASWEVVKGKLYGRDAERYERKPEE